LVFEGEPTAGKTYACVESAIMIVMGEEVEKLFARLHRTVRGEYYVKMDDELARL